MESQAVTDEVIIELKSFLEQKDALHGQEVDDGHWARVVLRTLPDGRRKVIARIRRHTSAVRASGAQYGFWSTQYSETISTTKNGLLLRCAHSEGRNSSGHLFEGHGGAYLTLFFRGGQDLFRRNSPLTFTAEEQSRVVAQVKEFLGDPPKFADRFPLLESPTVAAEYMPWLDATDLAQVAKRLFGVKAYRKPVVPQIDRHGVQGCGWFTMWRGLVPTEWIVEAMADTAVGNIRRSSEFSMRTIRRILVRTPQPVLRRMLREDQVVVSCALNDAARIVEDTKSRYRDLDLLTEAIAARGQKHVRGVRELEQVIFGLPVTNIPRNARSTAISDVLMAEKRLLENLDSYNTRSADLGVSRVTWDRWTQDVPFREAALLRLQVHERELLDEQVRIAADRAEKLRQIRLEREKERAAWARQTGDVLSAAPVAGMRVTVAGEPKVLKDWGNEMHTCIGGYTALLGLDVFLSLADPESGATVLNIQITQADGVVQCLGRYNQDAAKALGSAERAGQLVADFEQLGVPISPNVWGLHRRTELVGI